MSIAQALAVVGIAVGLAACSGAPTARQLGQNAIDAMGGVERVQRVNTLTMKGGVGTRFRHGQSVKVGDAEPAGMLKNVIETLDRVNNRAALDYELQIGAFGQHRREILTKTADGHAVGLEDVAGRPLAVMSPSGLFSWGTQNHPEFLLKRNVIGHMRKLEGNADFLEQLLHGLSGLPALGGVGHQKLQGHRFAIFGKESSRLDGIVVAIPAVTAGKCTAERLLYY